MIIKLSMLVVLIKSSFNVTNANVSILNVRQSDFRVMKVFIS